ncbi:hypothetical protein KEM55_002652 [Ascosphaera atra]|nr:hypothetical protein KEM55_002652 [Ascosphaera atra]
MLHLTRGLSLLILASSLLIFFSPVLSSSLLRDPPHHRHPPPPSAGKGAVGGTGAGLLVSDTRWFLANGIPKLCPLVSNVYATIESKIASRAAQPNERPSSSLPRKSTRSLLAEKDGKARDPSPHFSSSPAAAARQNANTAGDQLASTTITTITRTKQLLSLPETTARWLLSLVYTPSSSLTLVNSGPQHAAAAAAAAARHNDSAFPPSFVNRIIPFPSVHRSIRATADDDKAKTAPRSHFRKNAVETRLGSADGDGGVEERERKEEKVATPPPSSTEAKIPMKPQPQPQLQPAQNVEVPTTPVAAEGVERKFEHDLENRDDAVSERQDKESSPSSSSSPRGKYPASKQQQQQQSSSSSSLPSTLFAIIHTDPPPGKGISLREKEIGESCLGLVIGVVFAMVLF